MMQIKESIGTGLILLTIVLISTALLTWADGKTTPIIERNEKMKANGLMATIFPDADRFVDQGGYTSVYYGDSLIGYIVRSKGRGYSSEIAILAGFNTDRSIQGIVILSQQETPGLGTKIAEPSFISQFAGRGKDEARLKKDGGAIDAVTGATRSSRAVIEAVRIASEALP